MADYTPNKNSAAMRLGLLVVLCLGCFAYFRAPVHTKPLAVVTDGTFGQEVLSQKHPMVVYFFRSSDKDRSQWDKGMEEENAKLSYWKYFACNLDNNPQLVKGFQPSTPCLMVFDKGQVIGTVTEAPGFFRSPPLFKSLDGIIYSTRQRQGKMFDPSVRNPIQTRI